MASVYEVDVGDFVQTMDKHWHEIIGVKFHTRKGVKPHTCVGKHEKPKGLIRDWSITTKDGLILGMRDINRYAVRTEITTDDEIRESFAAVKELVNFLKHDESFLEELKGW